MQFMEVCKEKPESLPPLETIGLEADAASNSGFRRSGGSRNSSLAGQSRSGVPSARGGFNMGMGTFSSGTGKTSAERFAASSARPSSMSRQPSTGGASFGPGSSMPSPSMKGGRVRSERGRNRSDMPSFTPPAMTLLPETPVAPLVESANRWNPSARKAPGADENSPAFVDRKVKALLNKLTMENFDSISTQILTWANKSEDEKDGQTLRQVIRLVFEKATDEAHWSTMYARLCRLMMEKLSTKIEDEKILDNKGQPVTGGGLFRKYLLNRCQEDFERGWAARTAASAAAKTKEEDDNAIKTANDKAAADAEAEGGEDAKPKEEAALMSDEYYAAQKAKRQGLGLVRLIGELFKLDMLTERIMHVCIKQLLSDVANPEEEDIESLCRLLTTVGKQLDTQKSRGHMDIYIQRMREMSDNATISSRMKFMILDVIELRLRRWEERNATDGVQTLAEIREKVRFVVLTAPFLRRRILTLSFLSLLLRLPRTSRGERRRPWPEPRATAWVEDRREEAPDEARPEPTSTRSRSPEDGRTPPSATPERLEISPASAKSSDVCPRPALVRSDPPTSSASVLRPRRARLPLSPERARRATCSRCSARTVLASPPPPWLEVPAPTEARSPLERDWFLPSDPSPFPRRERRLPLRLLPRRRLRRPPLPRWTRRLLPTRSRPTWTSSSTSEYVCPLSLSLRQNMSLTGLSSLI